MIDLIFLLLFNSFICFGFWNACLYIPEKIEHTGKCAFCFKRVQKEQKGVLWKLERWGSDKWYYKAIGGCLPCMASLHSIYVYWPIMFVANEINLQALIIYPLYILALSGLNYLINEL